MSDTLINSLLEFGLTELDAKLYEFLLTRKDQKISHLAKHFGVQRLRIYKGLQSLEQLGLLKRNGTDIQIESPAKLPALLQEKEYKLKRLGQDIAKIIPVLLKEYDSTLPHPTIHIFQGKGQFIQLMDQILIEENDCIYHFGSIEHIVELLGLEYADNWVERRIAKNIRTKEIIFPSHYISNRDHKNSKELRQVKLTPLNFETAGSYLVFSNKVALWNSLLPKMIVIEDAIIVQLLKTNFEILWSLL
jgi:sugar-specific transcriptional regulator TrmB